MEFLRGKRPPAPSVPAGEVALRRPPEVPVADPAGPLARLLPVLMLVAVGGMVVLYLTSTSGAGMATARNPMYMIFPVLMVVSVIGTLAHTSRGRAAELDAGRRDYLRYLDGIAASTRETASDQHVSLHWIHPDPGMLWTLIGGKRMWERRPGDPDFCRVRVGLGPAALATALTAAPVDEVSEPDPVTTVALDGLFASRCVVPGLPVTIELTGHIGLAGESDARDLVRATVCQLAVLHSPADIGITAVVKSGDQQWDWLKWLPHHVPRIGAGAPGLIVVVRDGGMPASAGPGAVVLDLDAGAGTVIGQAGVSCVDGLSVAQATMCARRLARWHAGNDDSTRAEHRTWAQLVGVGALHLLDPNVLWRPRPDAERLRVPIGIGDGADNQGVAVSLDIKEAAEGGMGPHGLCVGATGSGKSNLDLWHNLRMTTSAAIYCRISRDKAGTAHGVERQEKDCRKLAKQLGWNIQKVYVDNDISAYSGKRRPQYEALLNDVEAGRISGLIAWHPDRLHRRPTELETFIDLVERHALSLHTVQAGSWDLSTPSGRLNARVVGGFARYESEHRSARVSAAAAQRAARGGWHGGRRAYGWEPDGMTARDAEVQELNKAAEQIAAGASLRAVVADMNARKVPTTNGKKPWDSTTLRETLTSPRHAGLCTYKGEIVGAGEWPAIIPVELWQTVNAVLTDPSRRSNTGRGGTVRWLGSGIYVCGVCGSSDHMRARVTDGRKRYRCGNRIKDDPVTHVGCDATQVDRLVELAMVARLSDPAVIAKLSAPPEKQVDVVAKHDELTDCRNRMAEAAKMFATGVIPGAQLATINATLQERITALESEIDTGVGVSPLAVFKLGEDPATVWFGHDGIDGDRADGLSLGVRRELVRIIAKVTINPTQPGPFRPERVGIVWK